MSAMRRATWIGIVSGSLLAAGAISGQGQHFGPYLKVDGGVNLVPDNDVQTGNGPGKLSLGAGYRFDGVVGYEFGRWLAVELEGGLAENGINKLTLGGGRSSEPDNSSLTQIPLLVNVLVRYENETDFVPYIGGGAGGVLSSIKFGPDKDDDTVFAWQGKAGVIYKIDENAWLDAGYKLLAASEQSYQLGGVPLKTDRVYNHFFGVSVIWKF